MACGRMNQRGDLSKAASLRFNVACEHLLLALLKDEEALHTKVLAGYGVSYDRVRRDVVRIYNRKMTWAGPLT